MDADAAAARSRHDRFIHPCPGERILTTKPHPEQEFRACLGILRLVRSYGPERLEAACQRGMDIGARSYGSVQFILQNGLDQRAGGNHGDIGDVQGRIR